ncbi:MAG: RagB/SusD family nutrient uptake outer membrane protein [Paludibacter sp.]|nr:RagB/SusD family nutrient uptake outer membrane protein [Paludibacter sp.]
MKSKLIILIASLALFANCSLDEQMYIAVEDNFIRKESDVDFLIAGIYSNLQGNSGYKNYINSLNFFSEDIYAVTSATYKNHTIRNISVGDSRVRSIWVTYYQSIGATNTLMKNVTTSKVLSDEFKKRIMGELHFLRAFMYYELVRMYGGVPIRTEPVTGGSDFYLKRNTVDEVYSQIFSDLENASLSCLNYKEQPAAEKGRPTKGAAQAFMASAALTYACYLELNEKSSEAPDYYEKATLYADSVITSGQYVLLNNYADLFDIGKEAAAYDEVIFGIQFTQDTKAASASSRGSEWAYLTQPSNRYGICGNVSNQKGSNAIRIQPWFYDVCTTGDYEGDYRSEVSFLTRFKYQDTETYSVTYPLLPDTDNGDRSSPELYPFLDKYKDPTGLQALNNGNDLYLMRLAEVYLIKAEALNELNGAPTPEAYQAFNKIRERARKANGVTRTKPADLTGPLSKEEFRMKIYDERGLEFVGEAKRNFDNIRMRYIDNKTTMMEYRYNDFYKNMPAAVNKKPTFSLSAYGTGKVYTDVVVEWTPRFLIWPIPAAEMQDNVNMTQNTDFEWY